MIRTLTHGEVHSAEFWHLLWLACESDDAILYNVRNDLLSHMNVIGEVESGGGEDAVVGFAAYHVATHGVTLEYIATAESARGRGLGTQLIRELQRLHRGAPIFAQTDDDTIGFYRSLGFVDSPAPRDTRWPKRQRYDCVLRSNSVTLVDVIAPDAANSLPTAHEAT